MNPADIYWACKNSTALRRRSRRRNICAANANCSQKLKAIGWTVTPEDCAREGHAGRHRAMDDLIAAAGINEAYGQLLKAQYALDKLRGRKRAAKVKAMLTVAKH